MMLSTPVIGKTLIDFQKMLLENGIPLSQGSKYIQKKIVSECRLIKAYYLFMLIAFIVVHLLFLPIHNDAEEINPYFYLKKKYMGTFPTLLLTFPGLTLLAFNAQKINILVIYTTFSLIFQMYLLKDFLKLEVINCSFKKSVNNADITAKLIKCATVYKNIQR